MKTILVSGATGFIGNYVVDELLRRGHKVVATSAHPENARNAHWFEKVIYKSFDFRLFNKEVNYYDYFLNPDLMIHLAWEGLPNYKDAFHVTENLPAHFQLLQNLLSNGLRDLTVTGTCLEYGMKEGCLSEEMNSEPTNSYAIAKNRLRKYLEEFGLHHDVDFKWLRLFYIFGKGQNSHSLFSQLESAISREDPFFNMSGGEQKRDYLPIETVAKYICDISLQNEVKGIINCCSGQPVRIADMVEKFVSKSKSKIKLNKGYYPYPDYEPMAFWGDNSKLKKVINMSDPIKQFEEERIKLIDANAQNEALRKAAHTFNIESNRAKYSYNFSWMGRPIIQYPQDMIAMQEILWKLKPDLIIETGIAHGGSLIYYASILELIGKGEVLGIDIDIREHNRKEIENHSMYKRIKMIQGSAIDESIVEKVRTHTKDKATILVCLDSNHTHEHVLRELELYSPFVTVGSYIVVFDTIVEDLPNDMYPDRPWNVGNNPKTAVYEFLKSNSDFEIDKSIDNKLLISVAPEGYLKRVK